VRNKRFGFQEAKGVFAGGKISARRNDIQMLTLERHSMMGLQHDHSCVVGEHIHQHAFVVRIEMLAHRCGPY
jgi:hypothetical protein